MVYHLQLLNGKNGTLLFFSFRYLWFVYDLCYNVIIISQRKNVSLLEIFDFFPFDIFPWILFPSTYFFSTFTTSFPMFIISFDIFSFRLSTAHLCNYYQLNVKIVIWSSCKILSQVIWYILIKIYRLPFAHLFAWNSSFSTSLRKQWKHPSEYKNSNKRQMTLMSTLMEHKAFW
jgi:hypothetical protein